MMKRIRKWALANTAALAVSLAILVALPLVIVAAILIAAPAPGANAQSNTAVFWSRYVAAYPGTTGVVTDALLGPFCKSVSAAGVMTCQDTEANNNAAITRDLPDIAFSNPPGTLTTAEQLAVRNAIGAGTGGGAAVQSDWGQTVTTADDFIRRKPTLGTAAGEDTGTASGDVALLSTGGKFVIERIPNIPWGNVTGAPDLVNNRGAWSRTSAYAVGDVAAYDDELYYCIAAVSEPTGGNFNSNPTVDTAKWIHLTADAQQQADWAETDSGAVDYIKNKPTLATVATSGDYDDLTDKPTIPTVPARAGRVHGRGRDETGRHRRRGRGERSIGLEPDHDHRRRLHRKQADHPRHSATRRRTRPRSRSTNSTYRSSSGAATYEVTPDEETIDTFRATLSESSGTASIANFATDVDGRAAMSATDKTSRDSVATGGEVNVQSDWNQTATDQPTTTWRKQAGPFPTLPDAPANQATVKKYELNVPASSGAATWVLSTDEDTTYTFSAPLSESSGTVSIANATTSAAGAMSATDKTKLDGVATGAEVNVQSDWNQTTTTADDYIENKPSIPDTPDAPANQATVKKYELNVPASSGAATWVLSTDEDTTYTFSAPLSESSGTVSIANATTSAAGAMSATDKTKLDGVARPAPRSTLATSACPSAPRTATTLSRASSTPTCPITRNGKAAHPRRLPPSKLTRYSSRRRRTRRRPPLPTPAGIASPMTWRPTAVRQSGRSNGWTVIP